MVNEYDIGRIPALTFSPKEFLHFDKTQVSHNKLMYHLNVNVILMEMQ